MTTKFEQNTQVRFKIISLNPAIPLKFDGLNYIFSQIDINKIRLIITKKVENEEYLYLLRHYNPEKWSFLTIGLMGVGQSINEDLEQLQQYYGIGKIAEMVGILMEMDKSD